MQRCGENDRRLRSGGGIGFAPTSAMKLIVIALVLAAVSVAGCSKNDTPTTPTPAACAYTVSSTSQSPASGGGTIGVTITRTSGSCTWAASSNASWITFPGASSGTDTATLTMAVAPNQSTSSRGGTVTVSWNGGNAQIAVNQSGLALGDCIYSFVQPAVTVPAEGGSTTAVLSVTGAGCSWTASVDAAWLTITAGASGTTSSSIVFTAQPNPDATIRGGTLTVTYPGGTAKAAITQAGVTSCIYTLTPSSQSAPNGGGSFSFVATRNTQNGCAFSVSTTTPWITLTGPTSGLSGTTVTYSVAPNGGASRVGAIDVIWSGGNGQVVVTQAGATLAAARP